MSSTDSPDIIALAAAAKALGCGTPEKIVERLEKIIERNDRYVKQPHRRGRAFNTVIEDDNKAIAAAIVLIESLAASDGNEAK